MTIRSQLVSSQLSSSKFSSASYCKEPKNFEIIFRNITRQLLDYHSQVAQYYSIPNFLETHRKQLNSTLSIDILAAVSKTAGFQVRVYGEPSCKRLRNINRKDSNEEINSTTIDKLATCPWHVSLEYDKNRIPAKMMKAICTCGKCYRNDGSLDREGRCKPVEIFSPVIRKVCLKGVYDYFVDIESVPVGCTCKRNFRSKKEIHGK